MSALAHIADRVLNRPLLLAPEKAQVILAVLAGRLDINSPDASRFEGSPYVADGGRARPYNVKGGVAIITIVGSLVNRGSWVGANSGLVSYEGIAHQLKTAASDPAVHSVILDLHTPGGEAVGAFEVAAQVRALAGKKRTVAMVNGMAASAGYAIASGASEIVTTETGVSGSIGVVLLHADFSRELDKQGITPTLIHAGAHKVDGNPFEPLTSDVRGSLQAEVNSFYDAFLKAVAKGRGARLTAAAARKTEARTFIGQAAVDAGIADRVSAFESVLGELSRAVSKPATSPSRGAAPSMTKSERFQAVRHDPRLASKPGLRDLAIQAAERAPGTMSADAIIAETLAVWGKEPTPAERAELAAHAAARTVPQPAREADPLAVIGQTGRAPTEDGWSTVLKSTPDAAGAVASGGPFPAHSSSFVE
jgi:signal peptide peptidase SppA